MVKEFEDAAFSLKKDQVSDLIKSQFGYHIIKVTDTKTSGVQSFDDVKDELKKQMKTTVVNHNLQKKASELRSRAEINIDQDKIKSRVK